jgi:predicted ATPase
MRKFIITGGPNSGKSAIIHLLSEKGYTVLGETARLIIETKGLFPWDDQKVFCQEIQREQLSRERQLSGNIVFLDRSLVDPIAYAEVAGIQVDKTIYKYIDEAAYELDVFFFEMLPYYLTDEHRKETPDQALKVHERLRTVYTRLGFNLVDVPLLSEDEYISKNHRLDLIIQRTRYITL